MADETTTTTAGELVAAEIVSRLVIDAAYGARGGAIMPRLVRADDISGETTLVKSYPKWNLLSAGGLTEATDLSNTAINPTEVSVTSTEVGLMATITDVLLGSAVVGSLAPYATEMGKALANKIDTDVLAEVADYTNSVGTTTVDMTHQDYLDAIFTLENGNAVGPFVCVLHPVQIADLRTSLTTSGLATWDAAQNAAIGAMASLFGIDIVSSTNCAAVNTAADRQGVMMPLGFNSGLVWMSKRLARTEFERDASLRATEIVVTSEYGDECVNIAANGGVAIITDA
jgi:hypothetical protein